MKTGKAPWLMTYRIFGIVVGGIALMGGASALGGIGLHAGGMSLTEAMNLSSLLGFLFYVGLVMWGFAQPSLARPTLVLVFAASTMIAATLLTPSDLAAVAP